jgi:tape measure domain-containing protein
VADVTASAAIIFTADTSDADKKLADITKQVEALGKTDAAGISGATKSIDDLGKSASGASVGTKELGDGLKKLAEDAGVPAPVLNGLEGILSKIGTPVGGTAIAAAAAITALAVTFAKINADASTFKAVLENVSGGAIDTEKAFQFVVDVTKRIESNLNDTLAAYQKFLIGLEGTGVSTSIAENAFEGILKAVEGIGGTSADAQKGLDTFIRVIADGKIKLNEFDDIARAIPGGLRVLADSIGVPVEQLREFAGKAGLGKDAIEAWALAMKNQDYNVVGLGGVNNAFNDLLTTIKLFGLELGAQGQSGGGFWIIEEAIRSLTLVVRVGAESFTYWGTTFANVV